MKKTNLSLLLPHLLIFITLTGCTTYNTKELSREEYLSATTHIFKNTKKEDVIKKAVEVLKLADPDDISFAHKRNGFTATRSWSIHYVYLAGNGTDYYTLSTEQKGEDVEATIEIKMTMGSSIPKLGGAGIYELFWHRLEYLLGKQDKWLTCEDMKVRNEQGLSYGSLAPLCLHQTVEDNTPPPRT